MSNGANQNPIREILFQRYSQRKNSNPQYSMHAFAKRLGISSGALSGILAGTRKISRKMALRLVQGLELEHEDARRFLAPFHLSVESHSTSPVLQYQVLDIDRYKIISEWQHFAILSLVKLDTFRKDPAWIAKRLGIPKTKASLALERLLKFGLLKEANGRLIRSEARYSTTDEVACFSVREAHRKNMELASESLSKVPIELRDITAITLALDSRKLKEAKELIRQFQDRFAEAMEIGPKNEVYKLCMQLFPLTNVLKKEKS